MKNLMVITKGYQEGFQILAGFLSHSPIMLMYQKYYYDIFLLCLYFYFRASFEQVFIDLVLSFCVKALYRITSKYYFYPQ